MAGKQGGREEGLPGGRKRTCEKVLDQRGLVCPERGD